MPGDDQSNASEAKPRLRHPPDRHVRRGADFERAFRRGSRARGALLLVIVVENGLAVTRLGLSVGKVIWKRAVRRNRVRRIFREAFRLEQHRLPAGVDIVLVPAEKRLEPQLGATREELVALTRKAHRRLVQKREQEAAKASEPGEGSPER